jgi:hypothetical protein
MTDFIILKNLCVSRDNKLCTIKKAFVVGYIGLNEKDISTLVSKIVTVDTTSQDDKKERINNLIALLERKVSERVYSENRQKNSVNTNKYTMDPAIDISFKTYADVPFDTKPSLTPSFKT